MASFASSATGDAHKHAWTKIHEGSYEVNKLG